MTRDTAKAVEQNRELTPDELNRVSGGVVCITHAPQPCMPAVFGIGIGTSGVGGTDAGKVDTSDFSISTTIYTSSPLF